MHLKRLVYILLVFVVFSCSTEKNKMLNRGFHNMNARYNGYFNAGLIIQESLIDFHAANKDDYTKLLPVFIIPTEETSKSLYAPMDKAISKTSVVIKKHSMPNPEKHANKKEEWCKWIDDNWMVMGKAYFYKRDFTESRTRFEFVYKQYQDKPIKYEAMLWNAKNWLELGDYVNAYRLLERLQEKMEEQTDKAKIAEKKKQEARAKKSKKRKSKSKYKVTNINPPMSSKLYDDIEMTWADYYLRKKDWDKAKVKLEKSIKLCKNKKQRARLYFILGQLAQQRGDKTQANIYYYKVDKLNPEYEMEFYSRIFRALNYDGGNSAGLKRQLVKMAKDEKNKDYLDQIYYALAEIELREQNRPGGVAYLQKSVKYSTTNERQKGLSYKRLGDLFYDDKKFIKAKAYYDSTMAHLPKEYEFYSKVREKSEGLKDLVTNLLIIQEQDSLQRLARMSDTELDKYLSNLVQKEDEEEERRKREEENKESQLPTNLQAPGTGSTAWVFYNPSTLAQGNAEFKKIWGTRKLEDDWRRSDRTVLGDITDNTDNTDQDSLEKAKNDKDRRVEKYKKTVPRSDKDLIASNEKLVKALYNAGAIYDERLKEEKLAIECFERVVKDFPESPNDLPSHYQLHIIYAPIDGAKSEMHKQYILEHYPDSDEAKILKNPNYKLEEAQREKGDEIKYAGVYELYKKRQYEDALLACNTVIEQEPANTMLSHYYYLRALTYGEMKQLDNFEKALSETALRYPKEEVGTAATDLLNYLRKKVSTDNAVAGKSTYIFEDNVEHFFVLVFKAGMGSVNDAKAKISNFDMSSFSLAELKITNNFLNTDDQVILVKKFENEKKAMDYYIAFKQTDMVGDLNKKADYFVITNKNYASFYVEKKVEDYKKFFEENYLNLK